MAVIPTELANGVFESMPPCNRVLFAPSIRCMEANYIDTTIFHGTFTYDMPRGVIKNADIVSRDILIDAITCKPGNFGVDANLTSKVTFVRTRHAANETMSKHYASGSFSSLLERRDGSSRARCEHRWH